MPSQPFRRPRSPKRRAKKSQCERCGFDPKHSSQLHLDHIVAMANGGLDEPGNWQTLCANCHALKTIDDTRIATARRRRPGAYDASLKLLVRESIWSRRLKADRKLENED
jgi:5-methylcytosine-specific restriction endonuclease McrA